MLDDPSEGFPVGGSMPLRDKQFALAAAGLLWSASAVGLAAFRAWIWASIAFAAASACWAAAMWCADRRRERLGSAVIRKTREFEAHAATERTRRRSTGVELPEDQLGELYGVEVTSRNLRTATTEAIRNA